MNNIFDAIPSNISDEISEILVATENVEIERIISKGHSSPETGWYDQDRNEWVIVLQGEAVLTLEGDSSVDLTTGSFINIPAHQRHKVKWTNPDTETIWLVIYY